MELSDFQRFEIERISREIDSCESLDSLKKLCKTLLRAYSLQRAATEALIKQNLFLAK
jgi:hypothetical protein